VACTEHDTVKLTVVSRESCWWIDV